MLRCHDGKLRVCNLDSAPAVDEDPQFEDWEGSCTDEYTAPNRDYSPAPSPCDDLYALHLSILKLCSREDALVEELDEIEEFFTLWLMGIQSREPGQSISTITFLPRLRSTAIP